MVRHMPNQQMHLDRVFRALGDPTRRAVLSRLSAGPAAVSELARSSDMALPSFAQHLDVREIDRVGQRTVLEEFAHLVDDHHRAILFRFLGRGT